MDAGAVERLLVRFEEDGITGLPVGPEPSAVLANAALAAGDRALRRLGVPFVRWCDDVTASADIADPAEVVEAWAEALAPLGLHPAPEKTRVVEPPRYPAAASWLVRGRHGSRSGPDAGSAPAAGPSGIHDLCELAVAALDGSDPHLGRAAVARAAIAGGREARAMLRHVRGRAPHLAATADWGLRR